MTPTWVAVLAAVLAALIAGGFTLAGVVLTQRGTARRENGAAEREERARTFEAKREAYVRFLDAERAVRWVVDPPIDDPVHIAQLMVEFGERMPPMQLYAPPSVLACAYACSEAVDSQIRAASGSDRRALSVAGHDRMFELLQAIRADLGVKPLSGSPTATERASRKT